MATSVSFCLSVPVSMDKASWSYAPLFKGHCVSSFLPPQTRPEIKKQPGKAGRALVHCHPSSFCAHMCLPTCTSSHWKLAQILPLWFLWNRKHHTAGLIAFKSPMWGCSGAKPHHYRYSHKAVIINCHPLPPRCRGHVSRKGKASFTWAPSHS